MYRYKITRADYDRMLAAQSGKCAICGETAEHYAARHATFSFFSVDHDHTTGEVRGLLCNDCNAGLGFLREHPERIAAAISYLLKG